MEIYDEVINRLSELGYFISSGNVPDIAVDYEIKRAEEKIKANINRAEIPQDLHYVWIDMAVGLFLFDKKAIGGLGQNFDFAAAAKKITEGDISVEFAGTTDGSSTPEERFDNLIKSLINPPAYLFARFRRLVW